MSFIIPIRCCRLLIKVVEDQKCFCSIYNKYRIYTEVSSLLSGGTQFLLRLLFLPWPKRKMNSELQLLSYLQVCWVFVRTFFFHLNNDLPSPLCVLNKAEISIRVLWSSLHNKFLLCSRVCLQTVGGLVRCTGVLLWQNSTRKKLHQSWRRAQVTLEVCREYKMQTC